MLNKVICQYMFELFVVYFFFIEAVRRNPLTCRATDAEVAITVKVWLKYAKDRQEGIGIRRLLRTGVSSWHQ